MRCRRDVSWRVSRSTSFPPLPPSERLRKTPRSIVAALVVVLAAALAGGFAAAMDLDLLAGTLGGTDLCALVPDGVSAELGIPSRVRDDAAGTVIEYAHLGLSFAFREGDGGLERVTVEARSGDAVSAYPRQFLGPVAKGATRDPVLRQLRFAGWEPTDTAPDRARASWAGHVLEVGFVDGTIAWAELVCPQP